LALTNAGASKLGDQDDERTRHPRPNASREYQNILTSDQPFSYQHGWLKVDQIISLNSGSVVAEDIVRTYQFLKADHDKEVRPPLLVSTRRGTKMPYTIEAVAEHEGFVRVRCWPVTKAPRTVAALTTFTCTGIVESEFGRDDGGEFDIPILICAIVSARSSTGLEI
jgi:hypothetical protein